MEYLGIGLVVIGWIIGLVCGIWILVLAFQKDPVWGIGCLLCGIVTLIFVIQNWEQTKKPFLINLGGVVLVLIGAALGGSSAIFGAEPGGGGFGGQPQPEF